MTFTAFEVKARRLVKECKYPEEANNRLLHDIIVTAAKSTSAYRKVIDKGKDITLNEVLDIYKNEASINAHLQLTCSDSKIYRIQDNYHSSDEEREEETVYRLQDSKCKYNSQRRGTPEKKTRYSAQSSNSNMNCNNCGLNRHKTDNKCPAHDKECNNCSKMNHYARVCRSSPKSKNSRNSPTKVHKGEFESLGKAILDLQTKIEEIQTQPAVATHSRQTIPPHQNAIKVSPGYDPPFFISKYEPRLPQSTVKKLHTNSIEVCQIKSRNSEHIWPAWISKSMHSKISKIDCEVDTGAGCNIIRQRQLKELQGQE